MNRIIFRVLVLALLVSVVGCKSQNDQAKEAMDKAAQAAQLAQQQAAETMKQANEMAAGAMQNANEMMDSAKAQIDAAQIPANPAEEKK